MISVSQSKDGQYYYEVIAKNNQTLVTSETYKREDHAWRGARALEKALERPPTLTTGTGTAYIVPMSPADRRSLEKALEIKERQKRIAATKPKTLNPEAQDRWSRFTNRCIAASFSFGTLIGLMVGVWL
jgi:uncharacterized protein YegP (UPF0339 family)